MSDKYSIGVDLGGTNLRVASYSGGVEFLDTTPIATRLSEGRDRVVRDTCEAIRAVMLKEYGGRRLAGIGIGSPSPLELPEGIVRHPSNLPGWDSFRLRQEIESTLGHAVEIESDANLAALAEQALGAGKSYSIDSLCVLNLGTSVGNGLILNGQIWHGATGMGGEAGHMIVQDLGGALCGCGGHGCLEQYASASAVVRMARALMGGAAPSTAREIACLARSGQASAISVFEKVGHALAIALAGLINTLNLPLYLLGGRVGKAWDLFAPAMFCELRERSYLYRLTEPKDLYPARLERHKTYVLQAQLGPSAALLGACLLTYRQREPSRMLRFCS